MANKKTIKQLESELDRLFRRMNATLRGINERRELIKKIRLGKVKQPAPSGVRVTLSKMTPEMVADFDDVIPSFGGNPAIGG
jgi:hypothetical protein